MRPLRVFGFDSSKQVVASAWLHLVNLTVAFAFSHLSTGSAYADECASYWATFIIDTVLCLMLNWLLLRLSERVLGYRSGKYGGSENAAGVQTQDGSAPSEESQSPELRAWMWQIAVYVAIVTLSRLLVVFCIILPFHAHVANFGVWGTTWIRNPGVRVVWVMVVMPVVLDTMALWITDQFIKFVGGASDDNGNPLIRSLVQANGDNKPEEISQRS